MMLRICFLLSILLFPMETSAECPHIQPITRVPSTGSPFAPDNRNVTLLSEQTSDNVRITGGCIDVDDIQIHSSPLMNAAANNATLPDALTNLKALPHVADNTTLAAAATTLFPSGVWRDDYAAGNGAPPLFFGPQTGTCVANSLTNNGGVCVDGAGGNSWKARLPATNIDIRWFGAKCDGTDETTAINNALAGLDSIGGGTLVVAGTCRADGAIVIPSSGTAPPVSKPIRITSAAVGWDPGLIGAINPSAGTLDLRYAGGGSQVAKIDTRGRGVLQIDHLTIKDGSGTNFPFLQTTNTSVILEKNHFIGNSSCSGTTCAQDIIILGGTTTATGGNGATDAFQGYGSRIVDNVFSHCRRAVTFRSGANGLYMANNTTDITCGSSEAAGAPYVLTGEGFGAGGNVFFGGIVEMKSYPYAMAFLSTGGVNKHNFISGLGLYDENLGAPTIGAFYFSDSLSTLNTVIAGFLDTPLQPTAMDGPGAATNTYINGNGSKITNFPNGLAMGRSNQISYSRGAFGVLNESPQFVLDVGDGVGNRSLRLNGGDSGDANGAAVLFHKNGVLGSAIGGRSAIVGGAFDASGTWYSSTPFYYLPSIPNIFALGTDADGKLINQSALGAGSGIVRATTAVGSTAGPIVFGSDLTSWTPTDGSGAGLTFTAVDNNYAKAGKICVAEAAITWPATADGTAAAFQGMGCAKHTGASGNLTIGTAITNAATYSLLKLSAVSGVQLIDASGAAVTNATLSGKTVRVTMTYLID